MKRLFYFIKPLWLRKILTNILGFVLIYPFLLYSAESAFLIALFFSVFAYKKKILQNSVIDQIIIASICGSLFSTWHIKDIDINVKNKHILLVEDIVDTGYTLDYVKKFLDSKGAKSVKCLALLDKPERRKVDIDVEYIGFTIPDKFIVGYGIDYAQKYRNLDHIAAVTLI